ncbi:hypothetical protein R3P38DRAFT_3371671 [Favolaschia claudopus]|uniref:Uncharacterized protein n=1 Tax=Favolaschia claudopus TaxID=2862362 RepID=A0AAV9ZWS9_9AGAR
MAGPLIILHPQLVHIVRPKHHSSALKKRRKWIVVIYGRNPRRLNENDGPAAKKSGWKPPSKVIYGRNPRRLNENDGPAAKKSGWKPPSKVRVNFSVESDSREEIEFQALGLVKDELAPGLFEVKVSIQAFSQRKYSVRPCARTEDLPSSRRNMTARRKKIRSAPPPLVHKPASWQQSYLLKPRLEKFVFTCISDPEADNSSGSDAFQPPDDSNDSSDDEEDPDDSEVGDI